jgi:hypothetical protein
MDFLLNHSQDELFPKDKQIDQTLKTYIDSKTLDTAALSLQWLIDLQKFIEKGFIVLDEEMKDKVKSFLKAAFTSFPVPYEWSQRARSMIPVYKTFSHLFEPRLLEDIIDGFLKDNRGNAISFAELDDNMREGFAHLLAEVSGSPHYKEPVVKEKVEQHIKNFVKGGFNGGGFAAAFWDILSNAEKKKLSRSILAMWESSSPKNMIDAVETAAEFLKYNTDEATIGELSNRLIYSAFSTSAPVKTVLCQLFSKHAKDNTKWYQNKEAQILNLLPYLRKEKHLDLLRALVQFLTVLKPEQSKETAAYLKTNAPYAETRRAAKRL